MNRIKDYNKLATDIVAWIRDYADSNNIKSLVVGVSGGIDSAVVSTLCAMTGIETICVTIDIDSTKEHLTYAWNHINSIGIAANRSNVKKVKVDMSSTMDVFLSENVIRASATKDGLAAANSKSRLRMMTLYHIACSSYGIVVGTGNKVEDFGIGFYTKYGDGGVDMSPIADLYKTEVRELGRYLGISQEIIDAAPTDGLFADGRTDEDQIGATYEELEWAMDLYDKTEWTIIEGIYPFKQFNGDLYTKRQQDVISIYADLNRKNQHKMLPIPIFKLNQ